MDLYRNVNNGLPDFEYEGEIINFVKVKNKDINTNDGVDRYLLTTLVTREHDYLMTLYYQGKRVFGKRFDQRRTIVVESHKLLLSFILDIREREYVRNRSYHGSYH